MSGGKFDYKQYALTDIADQIENIIKNNDIEDEWKFKYGFSKKTLNKFRIAIRKLREAQIYAHRIDYLCASDDSETSFHERLKEDLKEFKDEVKKQNSKA